MKRKRSKFDVFNLAFLDVITCGFGAIVLLLLITKPQIPSNDASQSLDLEFAIKEKLETVVELQIEKEIQLNYLSSKSESSATIDESNESIEKSIQSASFRLQQLERDNRGLELVKESIQRATIKEHTTIEIRDNEVGGIPVDSEYVIFIVDTSGSMQTIWGHVLDVMEQVLDIHPKVRGFQIMNDNGSYLIGSYRGKWIPDTPIRRKNIMNAMRNWTSFSNSSPAEGLETALRTYARRNNKISVYIFGDDFTGSSYETVVSTVQRLNSDKSTGIPIVRVHAIGFISEFSSARYATLMRTVTQENRGAFLALPSQPY